MASPQDAQPFWEEFLHTWDEERRHILSLYPEELIDRPHVKEMRETAPYSVPASPDDIRAIELRLGYPLPLDLGAFYKVSNGWRFTGIEDLALVKIGELQSIPGRPEDYVRDVEEFFGSDAIPDHWRENALLISNMSNTGICVANPAATGQWEYACAEFGARCDRYGSFLELMKSMRFFCLHYLREPLS